MIRLRRSVLYVPLSNIKALEKSFTLQCDSLIYDLEDAVGIREKESARLNIEVINKKSNTLDYPERLVRVNGINTEWFEKDMEAVYKAQKAIHGIVIPKIESKECVDKVVKTIENLDASKLPVFNNLWLCIETPLGVFNSFSICGQSKRISALLMGTSDLTKELRARHTRDRQPLLSSLSTCLMAARANGIDAIDGVHLDLKDDEGFELSANQGKNLGYDGKSLIHPKTIGITNKIFSPSIDQVASAKAIIEAWEKASQNGSGVVVIDGKLIENLHVEEAKRIITFSQLIEAKN